MKCIIGFALFLFATTIQAKEHKLYQIDIILFSHQQMNQSELILPAKAETSMKAISLQTAISKDKIPYHLLPPSTSTLREEYWALHRKPQYKILLHYSWLQPVANQAAIRIPKIINNGWQIEGSLRVKKENFYLFSTHLILTPPDSNFSSFRLAHHQRLKAKETYYFDHPQTGVLVNIHPV